MNKEEITEELNIIEKPEFKTLYEMKKELGDKFDEYMYKCNTEFLAQIYEMNKENKRLKEEYVMLQNASDEVEDELRQRIDKAIEYISEHLEREYFDYDILETNTIYNRDLFKVKNILQGSDTSVKD